MKNNTKTLKAIALSLGLAAMLLPATMNAQSRPGGMFGSNAVPEENGSMLRGDRSTVTSDGFSNGNFGEVVPLGGGIAVLLAAGLGYVALKKKEDKQ